MKNIIVLVVGLVFVLVSQVGCVTKMNVKKTVRADGSSEFSDNSLLINQPLATGNSHSFFQMRVGGNGSGARPTVGPNGQVWGGYQGQPGIITVPLQSERYFEEETMRRYGFREGSAPPRGRGGFSY